VTDILVRTAVAGPLTAPPSRGGRVQVRNLDSVHDAWLFALNNADPVVQADEAELNALVEQVRSWQRPISVSSETPFQLCFRLEEPPSPGGRGQESGVRSQGSEVREERGWRVTYLLQARDDPSLFVPVKEAWKPRGQVARLFQARSFEPGEY